MQIVKTDQTGQMPRLIRVLAGRILTLLVLSCCGSIIRYVIERGYHANQ